MRVLTKSAVVLSSGSAWPISLSSTVSGEGEREVRVSGLVIRRFEISAPRSTESMLSPSCSTALSTSNEPSAEPSTLAGSNSFTSGIAWNVTVLACLLGESTSPSDASRGPRIRREGVILERWGVASG